MLSVERLLVACLLLCCSICPIAPCLAQAGTPASPATQTGPQQPGTPNKAQLQGRSSGTIESADTGSLPEKAPADRAALPPLQPAGRKSIGLALEGGGALGLAHIGVLAWFEEHHIPIDRIAGTSMGALVGGLYASGSSPAQIERIAGSDAFKEVFTLRPAYDDVNFRRRQDRRDLPQSIDLGMRGGLSFRNALLTDFGLNAFLRQVLPDYNDRSLRYDALPVPFRCVATDLTSLQPVVFETGSLPDSIRASISLPGIFPPVQERGHYLVDGGVVDNLPTDAVRRDLYADVVISVHLPAAPFAERDVSSIIGVFSRAFSAGIARNEREGRAAADIQIVAGTDKFSSSDYSRAHDMVRVGYEAAEQQRAALLPYALGTADWQAYLAARDARRRPRPGVLQAVRVEGGSAGAQQRVQRDLAPLAGQTIDPARVITALKPAQGNGVDEASFATFLPAAAPAPAGAPLPSAAQTGGALGRGAPDTGVLVRLSPAHNGPPFLLLGADVSAVSGNVTRSTLDARLVDQNLGGYGSELRTDVRLGFLTQLSTQYYRALGANGWYVQPEIGLLRQPVYLWSNQRRVSERLEQQAGGGLTLGRTFNRNLQLAAEWRAQTLRWHLQFGQDADRDLSGTAQTGLAHLIYDSTQSGLVSPRGMRLDLSAGALFHGVASENAPLVQLRFGRTQPLPRGNIVGFSVDGDTYFRRNVADPLRFTLGGPLHLSASSIDQYRGTDDVLARLGYLHQIASLPSGLGQGLYFTVVYEGGSVWSPEQPSFLRQDGVAGFVAATPLGAITVGGSVGDAGRRKVFFTFGRLF